MRSGEGTIGAFFVLLFLGGSLGARLEVGVEGVVVFSCNEGSENCKVR